MCGEGHKEGCTLFASLKSNISPVLLGNGIANGKPQPGSLCFSCKKWRSDFCSHIGRNAVALVLNSQYYGLLRAFSANGESATFSHCL